MGSYGSVELLWLTGLEHRIQTLVFLFSRVWARVPVVSLSKTLNHCFVLWMAIGPVCCVMHV